MNIDLILAGVPKGEDYYGPLEDRNYYATFYTGSKNEDSRFLVEVRQSGNKPYCYYNYIKFNTVDSETRGGGFFCLAMRTDMYCKDVVRIYHFLDIIFNKYVLNSILLPASQGYRYQITKFDSKIQEIAQMQKVLIDLLQMSFSNSDICLIDSAFNLKKKPGLEVNFSDCTNDNLLAAIKKYASISLSTTALLNRERNAQQTYESRLSNSLAAKEQEVANLQNELSQKVTQCKKYQTEISDRDRQIQQLSNEIKAKDAELKQISVRKDVSQIIDQIKDPIARLANYTGHSLQHSRQDLYSTHEEEREEPSLLQDIVTMVLPVLNLIVLLGIGGYMYYANTHQPTPPDNTSMLSQIWQYVQKEKTSIANTISGTDVATVSTGDTGITYKKADYNTIDIQGFSGTCRINTKYTACYKGADGEVATKASVINGKDEAINSISGSNEITFTPKEKGTLTIRFIVGDRGFERTVNVE